MNELVNRIKLEEEGKVKKKWELDWEENVADFFLEHPKLINQVKVELKNARTS